MNEGGRTAASERTNYARPARRALERADKLQMDLNWGLLVTKNQIRDFVELFPKYAVIVMIPALHDIELSEFTEFKGKEFVEGSAMCQLINWSTGDTRHWAVTASYQTFVEQWKNGGTYSFCSTVKRFVKHNAKDRHELWKCWKDHPDATDTDVEIAQQVFLI